jgi:WD40 repeat protein
MIFELAQDFNDAVAAMPDDHTQKGLVSLCHAALRQETSNLRRFSGTAGSMAFPDFLFQQMRNRVYCNSEGKVDLTATWSHRARTGTILCHRQPPHSRRFVRILEADPGSTMRRFRGEVRFSPDGNNLLAAVARNRIRVFDVSDGRTLMTINCRGRAATIDFSPDGKLLVAAGDVGAGSGAGFIEVFDLESGKSLASQRSDGLLYDIVTTHRLVVACIGNELRAYTITDLTVHKSWCPYGQSMILAIARTNDHSIFATGEYHDESRPARITVWDASELKPLVEYEGQKYGILSLAFSDDGSILASGSNHLDSGVVAWDWRAPGTALDAGLLSNATRQLTRELVQMDAQARVKGRVISTLETADTASSLVFFPRSSWLVAAESSANQTVDTLDVYNVFGVKPGSIGKLSGHSTVPIGVDVDPSGKWVVSLHADARITLWPAEALKRLPEAPLPTRLGDHSFDGSCRLVLSRDMENHGFLYLTDTQTGQHLLPGRRVPTLKAAIDADGESIVIFYWAKPPMNPYLGGDTDVDEPSRAWWQAFQAQTPIQCGTYPIKSLIGGHWLADTGGKSAIIDFMENAPRKASWQLPPGLAPVKLIVSPNDSWGAALLQDQQGKFALFRFDLRNASCHLEPLAWHARALTIFPSHDGLELVVALIRDGIILRRLAPREDGIRVLGEMVGVGSADGISCRPFLLDDSRSLVIRDQMTCHLFTSSSVGPSAEGPWHTVRLTSLCSITHDAAIRDAAVSPNEALLVLLDARPSVCIRQMSDMQVVCRRPMDREYTAVRVSRDGQQILAIGGEREAAGVSYALMDFLDSPSAAGEKPRQPRTSKSVDPSPATGEAKP